METFIDFIVVFYEDILDLLNSYSFYIFAYEISILDILIGALILSFAASFLWKGARG